VVGLRRYLNSEPSFADLRDRTPLGYPRHPAANDGGPGVGHVEQAASGPFDDQEPDVVDDDDGLDDGSEMVLDPQPPVNHQHNGDTSVDGPIPPPPAPPAEPVNPAVIWTSQGLHPSPVQQGVRFPTDPATLAQYIPSQGHAPGLEDEEADAMDVSLGRGDAIAISAPLRQGNPSVTSFEPSFAAGPSTASIARLSGEVPETAGASASVAAYRVNDIGEGSSSSGASPGGV